MLIGEIRGTEEVCARIGHDRGATATADYIKHGQARTWTVFNPDWKYGKM